MKAVVPVEPGNPKAVQATEKTIALLNVKIAEVDKLLRRASLSPANRDRLTEKYRQFEASLAQERTRLQQIQSGPEPLPEPVQPSEPSPPVDEEPTASVEAGDSLQEQLERSHRHREALLEWLVDLRDKVVGQTQDFGRVQQQFDETQIQHSQLIRSHAELEHRLLQLQAEHEHLDGVLSQENRERQLLERVNEKLRSANLDFEERARHEAQERTQLLQENGNLQVERLGSNQRLGEAERRAETLQTRVAELENENQQLTRELDHIGKVESKLQDCEQSVAALQAENEILTRQLGEAEASKAKLAGKSKKRGDSKDLEQRLQTAERERAEFERLAMLADRDRAGLASRVGRLEQELVEHHGQIDRQSGARDQMAQDVVALQDALARLDDEKAAAAARNEQLEELLILTEKELFQRQRQYNEECAKVESMADHFRQTRLDRESLETRLQLLAREKAEAQRRIREQARLIKLLKHDLEFFKPDRLVDSAENLLGEIDAMTSNQSRPSEWSL
jgi:chromosome segregation ATPase